jgi:hypothetical protein
MRLENTLVDRDPFAVNRFYDQKILPIAFRIGLLHSFVGGDAALLPHQDSPASTSEWLVSVIGIPQKP